MRLSFKNHNRCCDILHRYLELRPCSDDTKIHSILVNMNHSISDLNCLIEKYDKGDELSVDELRSAVREVDVMLTCLIDLRVIFGIDAKKLKMEKRLAVIFGDIQLDVISFRELRSLLLAHPVDTDRNNGKETVYLEDVRVASNARRFLFSDELDGCDFALDMRRKGDRFSHWQGLCFDTSVVRIGHFVINAFSDFNDVMQGKLDAVLLDFAKQDVVIDNSSISARIACLKALTKERYPSFITEMQNYDTGVCFDQSILDEVDAALSYHFDGIMGDVYDEYKLGLLDALDKYEKDLLCMQFDEPDYGYEYLEDALMPDDDFLDEIVHWNMLSYAEQKICEYLEFSDKDVDGADAVSKFQTAGYGACTDCGFLESQAGWAIIHIYILKPILSLVCNMNFCLSNGEIAAQYWAIIKRLGKMYTSGLLSGVIFEEK